MNREIQQEEYESLKDIYEGSEQVQIGEMTEEYRNTITIKYSPQCMIYINYLLPETYPTESIPIFDIQTEKKWLTQGQLNVIHDELNSIAQEYEGDQCLFAVIQHVIEDDFLDTLNARVYTEEELMESPSTSLTSSLEKEENSVEEESLLKNGTTIKGIRIYAGRPLVDRKSKFIAFVASVKTEKEVRIVFDELWRNKKISIATHNIQSYRLNCNGTIVCDFDDDGEHAAGKELLRMLEQINAENVCVMVSRWFGGILLGPDRFRHISNTAREALIEFGLVEPPQKKGKK